MSTIVALIVFALVLLFLEMIVPGGVLAVVASILILAASVVAWQQYGPFPAFLVFIGSAVLALMFFFIEVQLLSKTRLGSWIRHTGTIEGSSLKPADDPGLMGSEGEVVVSLRPEGRVKVGDRLYDARSESGWLETGERVRVIRANAFSLIVKKS